MGDAVSYSDVPEGFSVKSAPTASYNDIPHGFSVKSIAPTGDDTDLARSAYRGVANTLYKGINDVGGAIGSAVSAVTPQSIKDVASKGVDYYENKAPSTSLPYHVIKDLIIPLEEKEVNDLSQYNQNLKPDLAALGENVKAAANLPIVKPVVEGGATLGANLLGKGREAVNTISDNMSKAAKAAEVTPDMIRADAHQAYSFSEKVGANYTPKATNAFLQSARELLPKSERVASLFSDEPAAVLIKGLDRFKDTPMTLSEAEELDQKIGAMANKHVDLKTGKHDSDGQALYSLQQKLRDVVYNPKEGDLAGGREAVDASERGRELWSKQARLRDVDAIIERASLTENPVSSAKTSFRNLITNKARFNAFSPEEKKLIRDAAKSGVVTDLLRVLGSRLVPIGVTVGGAIVTGGMSGGLLEGAAAHLGSSAARKAAEKTYMTRPTKLRQAIIDRDVTALPKMLSDIPQSLGMSMNEFLGMNKEVVSKIPNAIDFSRNKTAVPKEIKIGDSAISYSVDENGVSLDHIGTIKGGRDEGSAKSALSVFTKKLDEKALPARLKVAPSELGVDVEGLEKLYRAYGFVKAAEDLEGNVFMVRKPKQ